MARCDALWFPSSWDEPLSRVLLEALACGAPIVAMPTGGTPEIIVDGRSGILAPDIISFVDAAQRLHNDASWRQQIQVGARLRAQQLFDTNTVIKHMLRLYNHVGGASCRSYPQLVERVSRYRAQLAVERPRKATVLKQGATGILLVVGPSGDVPAETSFWDEFKACVGEYWWAPGVAQVACGIGAAIMS
jgi:hypothetical protein